MTEKSQSITPHQKNPSAHSVLERKTEYLLILSKEQKQVLQYIDRNVNVINAKALEALLSWADKLPNICRKPRR